MAVRTKAAEATEKAAETTNEAAVENTTPAQGTTQETANNEPVEDVMKLVYIGPTLPAGKLKCNRIFEGTENQIKEELKAVIEEYPLVERMLVRVSELEEKKSKVNTAGTIWHKYYADIVSIIAAKEKQEV